MSWTLGNVEYPFIVITLRSTKGSLLHKTDVWVQSMVQQELFNHLLRIIISYLKTKISG